MTATGQSWHTKYRPQSFSDVYGQGAAVKTLQSALTAREQQAFILEGPSGVGKTTLARLCAKELGITEVMEVDAATNTGVDDMRDIAERANYASLEGGGKAFIIDECHRLSRQAWESLLKDIEEPPEGVYWFFCTTEGSKIISTVRSRCLTVALKSVSLTHLEQILEVVVNGEGLSIPDEVLSVAGAEAEGSPRQAIVNLQAVRECVDERSALAALNRQPGDAQAIDLARLICKEQWSMLDALPILRELKEQNPEGVRMTVYHYAVAIALSNNGGEYALKVMAEFETPCIDRNKIGDVLSRVARLNWRKNR